MAQKTKQEEIVPAGQEDVKALTTENSVVDGGTLVRPKENVTIWGTKGSYLGEGVEHTVHRMLAIKLVKKGQAVNDKPTPKKSKELEAEEQ